MTRTNRSSNRRPDGWHPRRSLHLRHGAAAVEVAFVGPVAFLFVIGLLVAGLGVFRSHQLTGLAAEGARWASVHGESYARSHNTDLPTAEDVLKEAIEPLSASLALERLVCSVTWENDGTVVTVALEYPWSPRALGMDFRCRAKCRLPVSQ